MFRHGWKLVILILIAALVFLWLIKAPVISAYITDKMGVQVTARTISVWPKETTIHHFRIANPPSFRSPTAFEVDKTTINYEFSSLLGNPCVIDQIVLDGVYLYIDILSGNGKENNWSAIGAQMPERKGDKPVLIHKLILRNMTVVTRGPGAKALGVSGTRHFEKMEFTEINSAEGFPTKELIAKIFGEAGILKYLEKFLNPAQQIKNVLSPLRIFGENTLEPARDEQSQ